MERWGSSPLVWGGGPQRVEGLARVAGVVAQCPWLVLDSKSGQRQGHLPGLGGRAGAGDGSRPALSASPGGVGPSRSQKALGDPARVSCPPRLGCRNAGQRCPGAPARWAWGPRLPPLPLFSLWAGLLQLRALTWGPDRALGGAVLGPAGVSISSGAVAATRPWHLPPKSWQQNHLQTLPVSPGGQSVGSELGSWSQC